MEYYIVHLPQIKIKLKKTQNAGFLH
jgi:hypothetical protein